jgi:hypothetical protein
MKRLVSVPLAFAITVVVCLAAALTIGPLGPRSWWHTVIVQSLTVKGMAGEEQSAVSGPVSLDGGSTKVRVTARPVASSGQTLLPADFLGSVQAVFEMPGSDPIELGVFSFMNGVTPTEAELSGDELPGGEGRLRISASSNHDAAITATITQRPKPGDMPVFWAIVAAGVVYVGVAVELLRRRFPPNPILIYPGGGERH